MPQQTGCLEATHCVEATHKSLHPAYVRLYKMFRIVKTNDRKQAGQVQR